MAVRSAKDKIRELRLHAGLTQEQMSEGICSLQALSRIETGASGVSPATFHALTKRAGAPCHCFPVFSGRKDFDCFYTLKRAQFYIDARQLTSAWSELLNVEKKGWAGNRLHFQEWLLLHCELRFYSGCCSHSQNFKTLSEAWHITRPNIEPTNSSGLLLSDNEIRILIALAQEALYLNRPDVCLQIHEAVIGCLNRCIFASMEKERLQAADAVVYTKYLIAAKDYDSARETADFHRHKMVVNTETSSLFELTFLTGLCCHYTGDPDRAQTLIKAAFYSAYATDNSYATLCRNFLRTKTNCPITGAMSTLPDLPITAYPAIKPTETAFYFNVFSDNDPNRLPPLYTLSDLIRDLRIEQQVSQRTLCQGLCSPSKLSKIENGSLQPDIALTEALLQRLGLSEKAFTFWGSENEVKFYELRFRLIHCQNLSKKAFNNYMNEMKHLPLESNVLWQQEYFVNEALNAKGPTEELAALQKALQLTLPKLDITRVHRYRLSWQELSILNSIGYRYKFTAQSYLCSSHFMQILAYAETIKPDPLLAYGFLSQTCYRHCRTLYTRKLYSEALAFHDRINLSLMKSNLNLYGGYQFYFSQILGECARFEKAEIAAIFSYGLSDFVERFRNGPLLRKTFQHDFSIDLNY